MPGNVDSLGDTVHRASTGYPQPIHMPAGAARPKSRSPQIWWLRWAGYHNILWFSGLTVDNHRRTFRRSAGSLRRSGKLPGGPRRDGSDRRRKPWLEAHRPSSRSYRPNRTTTYFGAWIAARVTATTGSTNEAARRRRTGDRSTTDAGPATTIPSSSNKRFVVPGARDIE